MNQKNSNSIGMKNKMNKAMKVEIRQDRQITIQKTYKMIITAADMIDEITSAVKQGHVDEYVFIEDFLDAMEEARARYSHSPERFLRWIAEEYVEHCLNVDDGLDEYYQSGSIDESEINSPFIIKVRQ